MFIFLLSSLYKAEKVQLTVKINGTELRICHSEDGIMVGDCDDSEIVAETDQTQNTGKTLYLGNNFTIQDTEIFITSIANDAFKGSQLKNIILPDTITKIGSRAFKNSLIQDINIYETKIDTVTKEMLYGCSNLKQIILPSTVCILETSCFSTSKIHNILFNSKIYSIPASCFYGCTKLSCISVNTNECSGINLFDLGVTTIGISAFSGCASVQKVHFGTQLTISENSFQSSGLIYVDLRQTKLEQIPQYAFASCPSLTEFWLSNQCNQIEAYAFKDCRHISFYIGGSIDINVMVGAFNEKPIVYSVFDVHFGQYDVTLISHIPSPGENPIRLTPTPKMENQIETDPLPTPNGFELQPGALSTMTIIAISLSLILIGIYIVLYFRKLLKPDAIRYAVENRANDVDTNL